MSKIDLVSRQWCDLVFEGRNKEYGAYRLRANAGKRQLRALLMVLVLVVVVAIGVGVNAAVKALTKDSEETYDAALEMSQLKKEEKKEEKQKDVEVKYEKPVEKVAVKASIQLTIPKIVDDDKVIKDNELKNMDELVTSKAAISSATYKGDVGGTVNMDDLKANQSAGGTATPEVEEEKVYTVVEVQPSFPGGEAALLKYISTHLKYPSIAEEQDIQGVVVLRFVVLEDGSIGDVVVQKSLHPECDKAAVKVVKTLPRFVPGKQQGKPVKVWFTCPIRFVITG